MNLPECIDNFEPLQHLRVEVHLAIGIFDGVHLGHKAVVESAVASARCRQGVSAVLTFDPHPSRLFKPENPTRLIMPIHSKVAMLRRIGVDCVICKHFDRDFAAISAESFLAYLKKQLPTLKSIYVGENFRFGQQRVGDIATLVSTGRDLGIGVFSAERIKQDGVPISSTRIRREIEAGNIAAANNLLGYNYGFSGRVVAGAKLGRKLGYPTLNLPWVPDCQPRYGVYSVRFREAGKEYWAPAVANYGTKPTVGVGGNTSSPELEVHALNGTQLDVGDTLEVEWLQFIRPEQKFDSIETLKVQIANDCETAMNMLA